MAYDNIKKEYNNGKDSIWKDKTDDFNFGLQLQLSSESYSK